MPTTIRLKRAYDDPEDRDGLRVLVDRLWPRGVSKDDAALDQWCKHLAPSDELRKWFNHDPDRFDEFAKRYREQLKDAKAEAHQLLEDARGRTLTLVYGAKDEEHNHAVVLRDWLESLR